jgi:tripartite ATP-independent transporter DctP family solute receptor
MEAQVVRMGGYQGPASVHNRATYVLGEALAEKTGGETSVTLIEDVTKLGRNSLDLFDMVEGNELDACYFASSYLVHRVPNLAVFDLPFAIRDRETIYSLLDNGLGKEIKADVARRTGFVVLGFWDNGFRHFTNRLHAIRTPDDCKGLSIRTMNSVIHQETFRALGFQPDFIDIKDYPTAVRTGVVDAQENPLTNTVNFAVHETHPYLTMTGHFYGTSLVLGNAERIAAWPKELRAAFDAAMQAATVAQRRLANEEDERCFPILSEAGVEVIRPGDFDRPAFEKATAGVLAATAEKIDDSVMRFFRQ